MTRREWMQGQLEAALRAVPLTTRCGVREPHHRSDCYWPDYRAMAAAVLRLLQPRVGRGQPRVRFQGHRRKG